VVLSVSDDVKQAFLDGDNNVSHIVKIYWSINTGWVDESDNLLEIHFTSTFNTVGTTMLPSSADTSVEFVFDNLDFRYSVFNTTSEAPHDSSIIGEIQSHDDAFSGVPIQWYVKTDVHPDSGDMYWTTFKVFDGVIKYAAENSDGRTITFYAHDTLWELLQNKIDTKLYINKSPADILKDIIDAQLNYQITPDNSMVLIQYYGAEETSVVSIGRLLASTECGRFFQRPSTGHTYQYKNYSYWIRRIMEGEPDCDFTSDLFKNLTTRYTDTQLVSDLSITWTGVRQGPKTLLYELDDPIYIPPGKTIKFKATFSTMAINIADLRSDGDKKDYYFASPGGVNMNSKCSINVEKTNAYSAIIELTNSHETMPAYLVRLHIWGNSIVKGEKKEIKKQINLRTHRKRKLPSLPTIQNDAAAGLILEVTKLQTRRTFVTMTLHDAAFLPYLELADLVTITDRIETSEFTRSGVVAPKIKGFIFAINFQITVGAKIQTTSSYSIVPAESFVYEPDDTYQLIGEDQKLDADNKVYP